MHRREKAKPREVARDKDTYRAALRNNAMVWRGVRADKVVEHPPLIRKTSKRGEVHYQEAASK